MPTTPASNDEYYHSVPLKAGAEAARARADARRVIAFLANQLNK